MENNTGGPLRKADPNTIQDKFLVGYQGWFTCRGDGAPVHAGHHGWLHWFDKPIPDGGRPNMDLWPDVSAYSPSELFPAPGLTLPDGQPACLFSSRHPRTVQRHFHWMAEHGVDGCFLQRFAGQIEADGNQQGAKADLTRLRDEIGDRVKEAAEKEGRVFAIMYDVSGVPADQLQNILEVDWNHLIRQRALLDSPNYLRERGRPVVAIWGVGFAKNHQDPAVIRQIVRNMRSMTPGGAYIMAGTPTHWQTLNGDADTNPAFLDVYYREFDAISPWTVGRYHDQESADTFAAHKIHGDMNAIQKNCQERKVDYIPVVWPGGSEHHLSNKQRAPNFAPREGGKFFWRQIFNAKSQGARILYGAMWDEYDEGTALMPAVPYKYNLPREASFLALDVDGYDLPPDWYMRICGLAVEGLRGERPINDTFPKKELDDYWSSRPKFVSKSAEAYGSSAASGSASGSGSASWPEVASGSAAASSSASNLGSAAAGGSTAPDLLTSDPAPEGEDAPPPYTLESSEPSTPSLPVPPQQRRSSSDPNIPLSQQPVTTGSSSTQPTFYQQEPPFVGSFNPGSQSQPSLPVVPVSTRPTSNSQYEPSSSEKKYQEPEPDLASAHGSFVGGFGQGQPPHSQAPRPFVAASSSLVDEFYHYKPTDNSGPYQQPVAPHSYGPSHQHTSSYPYGPSQQPAASQSYGPSHQHTSSYPYGPSQQPATSHSPSPPIPTHTRPPLNPFPNASSSTGSHAQSPPPEWQLQDKPSYQPDQGYPLPHTHMNSPSPPPRHPSVVANQRPSLPGAYPHNVGTHQGNNQPYSSYVNYGQFPQHRPGNQGSSPPQSPFATPQSQHSPPLQQPQPPYPQSQHTPPPPGRPSNAAWGMVDRVAGKQRRQRLEQGVDTVVKQNTETVTQTVGAVVQSVDSVVQSGKKLLNLYKVPSRK